MQYVRRTITTRKNLKYNRLQKADLKKNSAPIAPNELEKSLQYYKAMWPLACLPMQIDFLYHNLNRPKRTKVKLSRSIFDVHCSAQFWWDNKKWRQFRVRMSIGQHSSHFPLNFQSCKISQPSSTSSISAVKSVKWNIIIQPKISYLASSLGSATRAALGFQNYRGHY